MTSRVYAYTLVYHEAALIAYWVRHYRTFCERVIVYVDVDSTDGTADIARAEGAEVRAYHGGGTGLDDLQFVDFANQAYRESIGHVDWVIWADGDELLYAPDMAQRLDELRQQGVTLPHLNYFVMASAGLPTHAGQIYDDADFRRGHFVQADAKIAVFNPNIVNLAWHVGKHEAHMSGVIIRDNDDNWLKLLHYRWLGEDYLRARDAQNFARLSQRSRAAQHGTHVYPEFVGPYHPMWHGPKPADAQDVLS